MPRDAPADLLVSGRPFTQASDDTRLTSEAIRVGECLWMLRHPLLSCSVNSLV